MRRVRAGVATLGLMACGGGAAPDTADSGAPAWCRDAPVVTWNSFGQGFMTEHCQACHASTTADRHAAPADITFDTHPDTVSHADRILERAAGTDPSMPPRGGVPAEELEKLRIWLQCWEGA